MSVQTGARNSSDGLVFHYDMNNSGKSWKGKPTTNIFSAVRNTDSAASALTHYFGAGASGSVGSEIVSGGQTAKTVTITASQFVHSFLQFYNGNFTLTANTTYSASAMVWTDTAFTCSVGSLKNGNPWTGYIPMSDNALTPGWNFVSSTGSYASTVTDARFQLSLGQAPIGATIKVIKPQIEEGVPSPYVNGTRSNTQALIDLTTNNTITANSLTYNSDGTFEFDGSSDYANAGVISNLDGSSSISFDAWVRVVDLATTDRKIVCYKRDANTDANFQLRRGYNTDGLYYQWHNSSWQTFSIDNFFDNTTDYHHVTIVHDPSATPQVICYKNGEQFTTYTGNTTPISWQAATLFIGYRTAAEYFYGDMDSIKIWNRPLTADEVRQNFETLRGRYGI